MTKANTAAVLPPSLATAALICSAGWTARSCSQIAKPIVRPALAHASLVLGSRPHRWRKALATPFRPARILPRARGIDEHAIPQSGAELRDVAVLHGRAGIDGRAEDPREDHHAAFAGVDPVSKSPFHLLVVSRIDVLLHHDHVLIAILRRAVAPERGRDLLGLALVVLLDLHPNVDAVGDGRRIDIEDAGNAGAVEDVPGDAGALNR